MNTIFLRMMVLFLVVGLGLIGCSGTETNTNTNSTNETTSNTETTTSTNTEKETIVLKSTSHTPPGPMSDAFDAFLDEIENRTNGQVKFERFYQGALVGGTDVVDALKNGVADVGLVNPSQQSGRTPLSTVGTNPAVFTNPWAATKALNEMYDTNPALQAELENVGVIDIGWITMPSAAVMFPSKKISSIADMKGLRMLTNTRAITTLIDEMEASPIGIPIVEFYEALSKGTADGVTISYQAGTTNGIHEIVKSVWELPVGGGNMFYGMSRKVWEDLPEDVKTIIKEVRTDFQADSSDKIYIQEGENGAYQRFVDEGIEIIEPSESDIQLLVDVYAKTVWDIWVKEANDAGLPGQEILDEFRELVKKYEEEYPF